MNSDTGNSSLDLSRNKLMWRGKINDAGEKQTLWSKF